MSELLPDPYFYQQLPTVISSGAAMLRDEHGRFVAVKPNYRDHWLLPGGGVDAGEDARGTTVREIREELGLEVEVGRLLVVNWVPSSARIGAPMGVHFVFDAGVIPAAELERRIRLQASELEEWRLMSAGEADALSRWGAHRARHALDVLAGRAEPEFFGLEVRDE